MRFLASNKDAFDALKSLATILAFFVGGFWTWLLFVSKRERFPRASVTQDVSVWDISDKHRLVRVHIVVKNEGDVLLCMSKGHTWLQQMKPWPEQLLKAIADGNNPVPDDETEFRWPLIGERNFAFQGQKEIEPKETDSVIHDFVVEKDCQQILVYSYLENAKKPGRNMGWSDSSIIDFTQLRETAIEEKLMSEPKNQKDSGNGGARQAQSKPRPAPTNPQLIGNQGQPKPRGTDKPPKK